ncbi:MAG: efflux RND transporter periplasmic adaptor subunit [Bacteroidota bacterium]|nr:efflux RND transporter periplasmic adaptor subunit [Bacteroidota bacterium]
MKKKLIYISTALIIIIAALYYFVIRSSAEEIKYRTEKVGRGDVIVQVRATGTVNPVTTVQVGSQVSETLSKIYVDFNSQVYAGQIIAQIDSTFLAASVKESEANMERVQAQVNEARRAMKRVQELFNKNLVSQAEMDVAQTNYETSLAQLKQAQASLDRAKVNIRYSIIRSPINGVVISRDVDVGQTVAASLQAPKLFVIAHDLKKMQVEANVDEADIGNIEVGQEVTFTVDAHPNREFKGKVTQVRLSPQNIQNVVTYTVIIEVPNPDMKLMPGMTATASILVNEKTDVLRVPALALRFQPPADVVEKIEKEIAEKFKSRDTTNNNGKSPDSVNHGNGEHRMQSFGGGGGGFMPGSGMGGGSPRGEGRRGGMRQIQRVWVLDENKNLKPMPVRTGISDNRFVEVKGGPLKEGDEIIVGMEMSAAATTQAQRNPFSPQSPTGGGGRRTGF